MSRNLKLEICRSEGRSAEAENWKNRNMKEIYEMDVYRLSAEIAKYKEIIDELGPKLNAFIRATGKKVS